VSDWGFTQMMCNRTNEGKPYVDHLMSQAGQVMSQERESDPLTLVWHT